MRDKARLDNKQIAWLKLALGIVVLPPVFIVLWEWFYLKLLVWWPQYVYVNPPDPRFDPWWVKWLGTFQAILVLGVFLPVMAWWIWRVLEEGEIDCQSP